MTDGIAKYKLGILLFDNAEVLDFCGPFEVFSIAGKLNDECFEVITLADKKTIRANNNLNVVVDYVITETELPQLDIIIVPGGPGTRTIVEDDIFINYVKKVAPSLKYILSVCTGVAILGKCGLVDDMDVTTHHMAFDFIEKYCLKSRVCKCRRFTDNGNVFTSAGISAGIDLAFYVVKKIFGAEVATNTARYMEYDWKDLEYGPCKCPCSNS